MIGDGESKEHVLGFEMLLLKENTGISRILREHHIHEPQVTNLLQTITQSNWICLNIGANLGYYTLLLSHYAYNGYVYAIEPHPSNYKILIDNISINNKHNVITSELAISNQNDNLCFYLDVDDESRSSLLSNQRKQEIIQVKCMTLHGYIKQHNITHIDLLQMDVEGAENDILEYYFSNQNIILPNNILIEFHHQNYFDNICEILKSQYNIAESLSYPHTLFTKKDI